MSSDLTTAKPGTLWLRMIAALLMVTGVALALPGGQLALLGGSPFYALVGVGLVLSGGLLWSIRASGAWLYLALLVGTLAWSLWEAGLNGWALYPRIGLFLLLGLAVWLACRRRFPQVGTALATIVFLSLLGGALMLLQNLITENYLPAGQADATPPGSVAPGDGDWPVVGRTIGAQRYSPLRQITPVNAGKVHIKCIFEMGETGAVQGSPIVHDGIIYINGRVKTWAVDGRNCRRIWCPRHRGAQSQGRRQALRGSGRRRRRWRHNPSRLQRRWTAQSWQLRLGWRRL